MKTKEKQNIVLSDDEKKTKKQNTKNGIAGLIGKNYDDLNQAQKDRLLKAALEKLNMIANGVIL